MVQSSPDRDPKPHEGPCLINSIPVEILREVFIQTFDRWLAPVFLFLVCWRWNEIARNTSILRSVIHVGTPESYPKMWGKDEMPVYCASSAQLTSILARLGEAKFELLIHEIPDDLVLEEHPLGQRCRHLRLLFSVETTTPPLDLPNMSALEELTVELGGELEHRQPFIQGVLRQLELSSPLLTRLEVFRMLPGMLLHTPKLLARLESFELVTDISVITAHEAESLMEKMRNVEELTLEHMCQYGDSLDSISPSVKVLSLFNAANIPHRALENIVELVVEYDAYNHNIEVPFLLHFPVLQKLEIRGSWRDLPRIQAPILSHLTLTSPNESMEEIKTIFPKIQIKTRILTVSDHMIEGLPVLLTRIWSDIEEFHWRRFDAKEVVSPEVSRIISGNRKMAPLCPNLWCFTVEFPIQSPDNGKAPIMPRNALKKLKGFADARKERGVSGLVRVRCGWSQESGRHNGTYYYPYVFKTWADVV